MERELGSLPSTLASLLSLPSGCRAKEREPDSLPSSLAFLLSFPSGCRAVQRELNSLLFPLCIASLLPLPSGCRALERELGFLVLPLFSFCGLAQLGFAPWTLQACFSPSSPPSPAAMAMMRRYVTSEEDGKLDGLVKPRRRMRPRRERNES